MLRLYGVTEEGHSCLVHVHGYEPYFFVQAPTNMTVCASEQERERERTTEENRCSEPTKR